MSPTKSNCLRKSAGEILINNYNNNVFSAASVAVSSATDCMFENWYANIGRYGENNLHEVDEQSFFDLASLTKPLVTVPSILHLIDNKKISWHDALPSLLEREVPEPFNTVELHNLLAHNAGFAAHKDYWRFLKSVEKEEQINWLISEIINGDPQYQKERHHRYSDLGYLLLGFIVEIKTGRKLDEYWRRSVAEPLGLEEQLLFPARSQPDSSGHYVSTGVCSWSGRDLTGVVHDDNCRALGGVAGHAGLFGSSAGVLALCKEFLLLYHGDWNRLPITPDTFKKACVRIHDSEWTCGFNLPSASGSSSGRFFSPNSLGHLGFTGVSFWIDIDRHVIVCLLTNRVIKGESREGIQAMRPQIHDAIITCLQDEPRNS